METNENEHTTAQNLWDTAKRVLRGKFLMIQAYLKKRKISNKQPNSTSTRTGGKTTTNNIYREWKEGNIKIRAELNDTETKRTIQRINISRSQFFEKINKIDKPLTSS